jgi:tetratricopeptide (TPR) repeat protein
MKSIHYLAYLLLLIPAFLIPAGAFGQYNCTIYTDSSYAKACRLYNAADSFYQGSVQCQYYLDSAIAICPGFAPAWHEKSVPYLKRGDFITWRKLLDKAVDLDPLEFLPYRGWCRFKFLRDYEGALLDLKRYDTLTGFRHNYSNDGNYELHVVMALCERELGHTDAAFRYFAIGIDSVEAQNGFSATGLYDYLHLGVTKMKAGDFQGAIRAFQQENRKYDKFADTYYYLGLAHLLTGQRDLAKANLLHARELMNDHSGKYHVYDIYCEMPDTIYPSDIDILLRTIPG